MKRRLRWKSPRLPFHLLQTPPRLYSSAPLLHPAHDLDTELGTVSANETAGSHTPDKASGTAHHHSPSSSTTTKADRPKFGNHRWLRSLGVHLGDLVIQKSIKSVTHLDPKNPDAWVSSLERLLPSLKNKALPSGLRTESDVLVVEAINHVLREGRASCGLDILDHLLDKQQNPQLFFRIIDRYLRRVNVQSTEYTLVPTIRAVEEDTLSFTSLTEEWREWLPYFYRPADSSEVKELNSQNGLIDKASTTSDLENRLVRRRRQLEGGPLNSLAVATSPALDARGRYRRRFDEFSIVLHSLGLCLYKAAKAGNEGRLAYVEYARAIIGRIKVREPRFIPRYRDWPSNDVRASQSPVLATVLSGSFVSNSSGAEGDSASVQANLVSGGQKDGLLFPFRTIYQFSHNDVGLSTCTEIFLWYCVETCNFEAGVTLLGRLARLEKQWRWTIVSRAKIQSILDSERMELIFGQGDEQIDMAHTKNPITGQDDLVYEPGHGLQWINADVVEALISGLVDHLWFKIGPSGEPTRQTLGYIRELSQILSRDRQELTRRSWDQIVVEILNSGNFRFERDPQLLMDLITLTQQSFQIESHDQKNARPPSNSTHLVRAKKSQAAEGLLTELLKRSLDRAVKLGDVRHATKIFLRTLKTRDPARYQSLMAFVKCPKKVKVSLSAGLEAPTESVPPTIAGFPNELVGQFLDLMTNSGLYDFVSWFLGSQDVDQPLINKSTYTSFIGPLLSFATTSYNSSLLAVLISSLSHPASNDIYGRVFQAWVQLGEWTAIEEYMSKAEDPSWAWQVENATALTVALLHTNSRIAAGDKSTSTKSSLSGGRTILESTLCGDFGLPLAFLPSSLGDVNLLAEHEYQKVRRRYLDKLIRVLSSVDPLIAELCPPVADQNLSLPARIPPLPLGVLNQLLRGICSTQTPAAGVVFVDKWYAAPPLPPKGPVSTILPDEPSVRRVTKYSELHTRPSNYVQIPKSILQTDGIAMNDQDSDFGDTTFVNLSAIGEEGLTMMNIETVDIVVGSTHSKSELRSTADEAIIAWARDKFLRLGIRDKEMQEYLDDPVVQWKRNNGDLARHLSI
ncbi:MAG: hypothetical protein M1814_003457 [Vezdaea aestivalis]|nr:MAG: hypothetical protein M1814_003457 [Vezdaea aestivalis]